jgi:hypothetical protein
MPNDNDSYKATLSGPNTNQEEIPAGSGLMLTKIRWWEIGDPVYYYIDNMPLLDLAKRDEELASQIQANLGGWLHVHYQASQLNNDSVKPFQSGTIDGMFVSADFPSTDNAKCYWQFVIPRNVNLNADINIRIQYAMSTSDTSKKVSLVFRYDYYEIDDIIGTPSASNIQTTIITPPNTMNQYQSYTDGVLKIPAVDITNSFHYVVCSIERDVTVVDNHSGKMQIVGITMNQ